MKEFIRKLYLILFLCSGIVNVWLGTDIFAWFDFEPPDEGTVASYYVGGSYGGGSNCGVGSWSGQGAYTSFGVSSITGNSGSSSTATYSGTFDMYLHDFRGFDENGKPKYEMIFQGKQTGTFYENPNGGMHIGFNYTDGNKEYVAVSRTDPNSGSSGNSGSSNSGNSNSGGYEGSGSSFDGGRIRGKLCRGEFCRIHRISRSNCGCLCER